MLNVRTLRGQDRTSTFRWQKGGVEKHTVSSLQLRDSSMDDLHFLDIYARLLNN